MISQTGNIGSHTLTKFTFSSIALGLSLLTLSGCTSFTDRSAAEYYGVAQFTCTKSDGGEHTLLRRVQAISVDERGVCSSAASAAVSAREYFEDEGLLAACSGGASAAEESTEWSCIEADDASAATETRGAADAEARFNALAAACNAGSGSCDTGDGVLIDLTDYLSDQTNP